MIHCRSLIRTRECSAVWGPLYKLLYQLFGVLFTIYIFRISLKKGKKCKNKMFFTRRQIKYMISAVRAAQIQRIHSISTCTLKINSNIRASSSSYCEIEKNLFCYGKKKSKYKDASIFVRPMSINGNAQDEFEDQGFIETEDHLETSSHQDPRKLLYSSDVDGDDLMQRLNACQTIRELQEVINNNGDSLQLHHRVQSIILLETLHKNVKSNEIVVDEEALKTNILGGLEPWLPELNMNELSCCYLSLRKLGFPNTERIMRDLLLLALQKIDEIKNVVELFALSRLSMAINIGNDFYMPMVCANFVPHILEHIQNNCLTQEAAQQLAICLHKLHPLIDNEILTEFKARVRQLLETNVLNAQTPKAIMKLIQLFNISTWSQSNSLIIRQLILALNPSICDLQDHELKYFSRIFQFHLEPAALEPQLKGALEKQLRQVVLPTADTLASYMPFTEPTKRDPLITAFKNLLYSEEQWQLPYADINFFTILRSLKISEIAVCDRYWGTILEKIENNEAEEKTQQRFLRHCHRYMHFNNNLGGTYRFLPLERKLTQMALNVIENDVAGSIPWKVARLSSFIFGYGHTPYSWKKFPNTLLSKIISMANQFTASDCFYISRGIQICLEMRFRYDVPSSLSMQLATIDNILLGCVDRHLQGNDPISIQQLNTLVRTLNNRKTLKNSLVYQETMKKFKTIDYSELNSRKIRDIAYNFTALNYIETKALKAMFSYIEKEHDHILGDTVEKVLTCSYNLGYEPESLKALDRAGQVLLRDFDSMSGLSIVQACLALCFYKTIPEELINRVFCVDFIKRIEDEIHHCYSKATYPERVLNQVMQLNRIVCLDFPEINVPWFQQNYIEAQMSKKPTIVKQTFSEEVEKMLKTTLKDGSYIRCNHTTPYGYNIDFVIHFDQQRKLIPMPVETTMLERITKVAILLMKLDSFCENDLTVLRGPDSLKTKHLEVMGYKVLHINEYDWNSKYMRAPGAKSNYIKCLLQIAS